MDKKTFEKLETVQRILSNVADKILTLTSGNVAHDLITHRSTLLNVNAYLIPKIKENAANEELKKLLDKTSRNLEALDLAMMQVNPTNLSEATKKHISSWIKYYANELEKYVELGDDKC